MWLTGLSVSALVKYVLNALHPSHLYPFLSGAFLKGMTCGRLVLHCSNCELSSSIDSVISMFTNVVPILPPHSLLLLLSNPSSGSQPPYAPFPAHLTISGWGWGVEGEEGEGSEHAHSDSFRTHPQVFDSSALTFHPPPRFLKQIHERTGIDGLPYIMAQRRAFLTPVLPFSPRVCPEWGVSVKCPTQ